MPKNIICRWYLPRFPEFRRLKTDQLKFSAFAAAICLIASAGRAQTAGNSEPNLVGTASANLALDTGLSVPATAAYLWKTIFIDDQPKSCFTGIAVDAAENVYGTKGCAIVRITPDGKLATVAGAVESAGCEDGVGSAARFNAPDALAVDGRGNLYVSDRKNHTIRKIDAAGVVTTLAGSPGLKGSADGAGSDARFYHPRGIGLDSLGNLFVGDVCNNTIRRINPAGVVGTLAGPTAPGQTRLNNSDTAVGAADGFAVDGGGNIYYVRHMGHAIRKVALDGTITTVAGVDEQASEAVDGPRDIARFQRPMGLAIDAQGNVYVTDLHSIRKMSPDGTVSTIGGKSDNLGREDSRDHVTRFNRPLGVAVSSAGIVYISCRDSIIQGTPVR